MNSQSSPKKLHYQGQEYFSLSEAVNFLPYKLSYIEKMAKSGALKAFKVGDDWLTTSQWLDDFRARVKESIQAEVGVKSEGEKSQQWVAPLAKNTSPRQLHPLVSGLVLLLFSLFLAGWISFYGQPQEFYAFSAKSNQWLVSSSLVSNQFLVKTYQVYAWPYQLVAKTSNWQVNDEALTLRLRYFLGYDEGYSGRVAGESAVRGQE